MGESLVIRKRADKSGEQNPDGSWPLAGVEIVGEAPEEHSLSTSFVLRGRTEGWISVEGADVVYRPAAPKDDPMAAPPHQFLHCDTIVIHTVDGDIRYQVTRQPDKYADRPGCTDKTKVTDEMYEAGDTKVDFYYRVELEKQHG